MKTCLVTGGAGFIGSNFILYMLSRYADVKIVNLDKLIYAGSLENLMGVENEPNYSFVRADICDREAVRRIFRENEVDYIVNFAAESHVDRSITNPKIFAESNVLGAVNMLACAREAWEISEDRYKKGVKFLQVSTDEVYGSLGAEGRFAETAPLDPHSPYSASKAAADFFVRAFHDTYGLPVNITRSSNNYGPRQFPEKLIPLMLNNALRHRELPVYGDGLQVRDWLYVEDHCKALDMVLCSGRDGEIYNIGGHNEKTNMHIVKTILEYVRENVDPDISEHLIRHVADRKGHDRRYAIDPSKIRAELGWRPETSFDAGLKKTLKWYLDNAGWVGRRLTGGACREYCKKCTGTADAAGRSRHAP